MPHEDSEKLQAEYEDLGDDGYEGSEHFQVPYEDSEKL